MKIDFDILDLDILDSMISMDCHGFPKMPGVTFVNPAPDSRQIQDRMMHGMKLMTWSQWNEETLAWLMFDSISINKH